MYRRQGYASLDSVAGQQYSVNQDIINPVSYTHLSLSQSALPGSFIPYGGNFYASNYTISLWLDASSLTEGTQTTLFGYYGTNAGQSYGANALYLTSDAKFGMGDGNLNTSTGSFSQKMCIRDRPSGVRTVEQSPSTISGAPFT